MNRSRHLTAAGVCAADVLLPRYSACVPDIMIVRVLLILLNALYLRLRMSSKSRWTATVFGYTNLTSTLASANT